MKTNDIRRVIDKGLANVTTTQQDVDAVMAYVNSGTVKRKAPVRKARVAVAVLVAIMLTLLLSVIAQGLGVPVWDVFVETTKDGLEITVTIDNKYADLQDAEKDNLSMEEISVWGDGVNKAFDAVGIYPELPRYMPEGFRADSLSFSMEDCFVRVRFEEDNGHYIDLEAMMFRDQDAAFGINAAQDGKYYEELVQDGITYRILSNLSEYSVIWYDKSGLYTLSGNVDPEVLKDMIRSIEREPELQRENVMTNSFSDDVINAWGEEICYIFNEIGIYPDLPSYVPEGFKMVDPIWERYFTNDGGYANILYEHEDGRSFCLDVTIITSENYTASYGVEFDYREFREVNRHGIVYYIGSNLSNNTAAWIDRNGMYLISGDLSINKLEAMVRSIERDPESAVMPGGLTLDISAQPPTAEKTDFTAYEVEAWGMHVTDALAELGHFPVLPQSKPAGMESVAFDCAELEEYGGMRMSATYADKNGKSLTLSIDAMNEYADNSVNLIPAKHDGAEPEFSVINGCSFWYVTQEGCPHISWFYNNYAYRLYGTFDADTLWDIVYTMEFITPGSELVMHDEASAIEPQNGSESQASLK